ncbi:MAG: hypothetical protein R3283_01975 [Balneolaceae bacterium]|nr:hypothetical protein [Balneolaceae bacterium]
MSNIFTQDDSPVSVDTLTESYSESWEGVQGIEQSSAFIQFMASDDLIWVVLGVSLIIWFILLFFIIRVDKKVSRLEKAVEESGKQESSGSDKEIQDNQSAS